MVEVTKNLLAVALAALFIVQAFFLHLASRFGSPRAYWLISWIPGAFVFWIALTTAPQVFPELVK